MEFRTTNNDFHLLVDGDSVATGTAPRNLRVTRIQQTGSAHLKVEILTDTHSMTPSAQQIGLIAATLTLMMGAAISGRSFLALRSHERYHLHDGIAFGFADAIVLITTLVWTVVGPPFLDDGWVAARIAAYPDVGGFSVYYSLNAIEQPLGYWYEALQAPLVAGAPDLVVQRILVVGVVLLGWIIVRGALRELDLGRGRWAHLVASVTYATAVVAWLMTLRPEPMIGLLAGLVLVLALRFRRSNSLRHVLLATVLSVFALTAHPTGVVTLAPLIAIGLSIVGWIRDLSRQRARAALGLASCVAALGVLLLFLDSDLAAKVGSIAGYEATDSHGAGPLGEFERYQLLSSVAPFSAAVRKLFVGLIGSVLLTWVIRRLTDEKLSSVPVASLAIALVLMMSTPSKWPWHFGVLAILASVAIAAVLPSAAGTKIFSPRVLYPSAAVALATAWAWDGPNALHPYDLQTFAWGVGTPVARMGFDLSNVFIWLGLAGAIVAGAALIPSLIRNSVGMVIVVTSMVVLLTTVGTVLADSFATDSWTFVDQNISALTGDSECGLGSETYAPVAGSLKQLDPTARDTASSPNQDSRSQNAWLQEVNRIPRTADTVVSSWHELRAPMSWVAIPLAGQASQVSVSIEVATKGQGGFNLTRVEDVDVTRDFEEWTLLTTRLKTGTDDSFRVVVDGSGVLLGTPFVLDMKPIDELSWSPDQGLLVHPFIRPYFPCTVQPSIAKGYARRPAVVVGGWSLMDVFKGSRDTTSYIPIHVNGQVPFVSVSLDYLTNKKRHEALVVVRKHSNSGLWLGGTTEG